MCDCGDPTAWDPNHFCSDHSGYEEYTDEKLSELLVPAVLDRAPKVYNAFVEYMHQQTAKAIDESNSDPNLATDKVVELADFFEQLIELAPMTVHYMTEAFGELYPNHHTKESCDVKVYIDEASKQRGVAKLEGCSNKCDINTLELVFLIE